MASKARPARGHLVERVSWEDHGYITPSFSRRVPLFGEDTSKGPLAALEGPVGVPGGALADGHPNATWERDLRVWQTRSGQHGQHECRSKAHHPSTSSTLAHVDAQPRHAELVDMRITVYALSGGPLPAHYRITLTTPRTDHFQHWSFTCTPFSFKSLIATHHWAISPGEAEAREFAGFGQMLRQLVTGCTGNAPTHLARAHIVVGRHRSEGRSSHEKHEDDQEQACLQLSFTQVVHDYRCAHLLTLDFHATPWDTVLRHVERDVSLARERDAHLRAQLVRLMEMVARHHPSLLLSVAQDSLHGKRRGYPPLGVAEQPASWVEHVKQHLLPRRAEESGDAASITAKKHFLMATEPGKEEVEPCLTKSVDVLLEEAGQPPRTQHLLFTFYAHGDRANPHAYTIRLTQPEDLAFSLTSQPLTPSSFRKLTQHMSLLLPPRPLTCGWGRAEQGHQVLGFQPEQGVGGVLGVVAGDLLTNVQTQPERYMARLRVESIPLDPHTTNPFKAQTRKAGRTQRLATLTLTEHRLYTQHPLLHVEFLSTPRATLQAEIQGRWCALREDMRETQERLDALSAAIRRQNPALLVLMGSSWAGEGTGWNPSGGEVVGRAGVPATRYREADTAKALLALRPLPSVELLEADLKVAPREHASSGAWNARDGNRWASAPPSAITGFPARIPVQVGRKVFRAPKGPKAPAPSPRFVTSGRPVSSAPAPRKLRPRSPMRTGHEGTEVGAELDIVYRWSSPQAARASPILPEPLRAWPMSTAE